MGLEQYPIWDQETLLGRMRGKSERVVKLVNLFLGDMPERIEAINQEVQDAELEALTSTAHTVKGVAANLGVMRLQEAAKELETAAKNEQTQELNALLDAINQVYADSESELRAFIEANS